MRNAVKEVPHSVEEISSDWCLGKPSGYVLHKPPKIGGTLVRGFPNGIPKNNLELFIEEDIRHSRAHTICKYKVTGNPMVNHLNRNTEIVPEHIEKVPGVRFIHGTGAWQARIKQDDVEYTTSFSVKKYGYDKACLMAVNSRKELARELDRAFLRISTPFVHNNNDNHDYMYMTTASTMSPLDTLDGDDYTFLDS